CKPKRLRNTWAIDCELRWVVLRRHCKLWIPLPQPFAFSVRPSLQFRACEASFVITCNSRDPTTKRCGKPCDRFPRISNRPTIFNGPSMSIRWICCKRLESLPRMEFHDSIVLAAPLRHILY